jgi:hypothetical protein
MMSLGLAIFAADGFVDPPLRNFLLSIVSILFYNCIKLLLHTI